MLNDALTSSIVFSKAPPRASSIDAQASVLQQVSGQVSHIQTLMFPVQKLKKTSLLHWI